MTSVAHFVVPPVVKVVRVRCTQPLAFARFTRDIHLWWPLHSHSLFKGDAAHVAFEPRVGGRLVERNAGGDQRLWGSVTVWEPPSRVAFTWHVGRSPAQGQTVEVEFTPLGCETEVRLTHSGWAALGSNAVAMRNEYDGGWDLVFVRGFCQHANLQRGQDA